MKKINHYLPSIFAGLLLAFASFFPGSYWAILLTGCSLFLLFFSLKSEEKIYSKFYLFALSFHLLAFFWLAKTLELFGGFHSSIAIALFVLYALISSLQFLVTGFFYKKLHASILKEYFLSLPLAWLISEFLFPRLFPWALGHLFLASKEISQIASLGGVSLVSFFVAWWIYTLWNCCFDFGNIKAKKSKSVFVPLFFLLLLLAFGYLKVKSINNRIELAPKIDVALIQGNLSLEQKNNENSFEANIGKYQQLTANATSVRNIDLVIWPESVVSYWIEKNITQLSLDQDPYLEAKTNLLFGALSYYARNNAEVLQILEKHPMLKNERSASMLRNHRLNSSFLRKTNGQIAGSYSKRILMPFGEYMPFRDFFPELTVLLPVTPEFTAGENLDPIELELPNNITAKIGMLICYEDLVARLTNDYSISGANLLVNLTNDAWYGKTPAPFQHNLLASFRAIETGRYLLRSTNTGLTAIINPTGRIESQLPIFEEGMIVSKVALLDKNTFFVNYGNTLVWLLIITGLTYGYCKKF